MIHMSDHMAESNPKLSLHHLRLSIPLLVIRVVLAVMLIELSAGLAFGALQVIFGTTIGPSAVWWIGVAKSLIELGVVLRVVLNWATIVYYIRDHQLVKFRGIIELDESVWELRSLKTVKLHQNWLGHFLGFGNLAITFSSSGYREDIVLKDLARARACEQLFHRYLEEATEKKRATDEEVPSVSMQS